MVDTGSSKMHPAMKLAWSGVGVSLAVAGLKFAAWWSTGSVALDQPAAGGCQPSLWLPEGGT